MPDLTAYKTILWSGKPLFICRGCAYQRFREDLVQDHCATCASLAALLASTTLPPETAQMMIDAPAANEQEA